MKLWKRAGSLGLSLALCTGLVLPALAHTVTIDGEGSQEVGTVQNGVDLIAASASQSGTITMDHDDDTGATIREGNVTLDLSGNTLTNDGDFYTITVLGGRLTLKDSETGGTVSGSGGVSVRGGAAADITGGTVSGDRQGVYVGNNGNATITGGTVTSRDFGVVVDGGRAEIRGGEVKATGASGNGVSMSGGEAKISGGEVKATGGHGVGVNVSGGKAEITGGATVSGQNGVSVTGGKAEISGGAVRGDYDGVYVCGSKAEIEISGGAVSGNTVGVDVAGSGSKATITGGTVSGNDSGVSVYGATATISGGATVTGETGVKLETGAFTMDGGTVGSTVKDGAAVDGTGTITLKGGTIYGRVPGGVNTDNVTVKDAPYVPPTPGPDPASDPLTRPAAARTLLEELFRRAGGSGDLWTWAVENGLIDEDGDGDEIVTVALLRSILTRYAQAFGGNAVAAEDLTTLTGEDTDVVDNCRAVLNEFFGE